MNRLIKYGIRTQAALVAVYSIINNNLSGIYFLIPWLVFELTGTLLFKEKPVAGLVLYLSAVLSSALVLNVYLFSGFTVFLIYFVFLEYSFKTAVAVNTGVVLAMLGASFVTPSTVLMIISLFPAAVFGTVLHLTTIERESGMKAEIDAQQNQIDGKNKLLSTLAHELRTQLAVIKTSSEILLEERPGEINTTQKKFLRAVRDNSLRMSRFIDSILASIKVEYAWFRMKKKKRDIRTVIKKVCNELEPFIKSRNQTIKYTYPNLLSKTVIDDNWIQQVLINLIHNASKHIGSGGRIIISVNENEQCVVVSVSDDGSGIINEDKSKIFSEFYQGKEPEDVQEDNFNGVGLGLSIVKNVIEKHGGNVYVGSVSGMGTTLSFTLPKVGE